MQVSNLRLINIDTCGAELDIIHGAVRTIKDNKVPYIVCGINRFGLQQMGTSEQELRRFMSYMGYETYWRTCRGLSSRLTRPRAICDI